MPYYLDTQLIRSPSNLNEGNSTQYAQQRALNGTVNRDYFGDIKRVWVLTYENVNKDDYFTLRAIYNDYLTNGGTVKFEITENNYTILETNVFIDLPERQFNVKGSSYISNFSVILTEA